MHKLQLILAAAAPAAAIVLIISICILFLACKDCRSRGKPKNQSYAGVVCHVAAKDRRSMDHTTSNRAWRTTHPIKPFTWSEHPSLIAEAVEHGWATFAFAYTCSTCPSHSTLWDICTGYCSYVQDNEPEVSWEIMGPSSDYMQKIRLNPWLPMRKDITAAVVQALQSALPLPGPPLGHLSFPQEAYYEMTIMAEGQEHSGDLSQVSFGESEYLKLMSRHFLSGKRLSSDHVANASPAVESLEEGLPAQKESMAEAERKAMEGGKEEQLQVMAVGYGAGGAPPFRLPGFDGISVGYHSNGKIFMNGAPYVEQDAKLHLRKRAWGALNSTIGCGFDPSRKRIFFTLNGELVTELMCPSSEFGYPLYPTVAANYDVTVIINFGQSSFEYAPANLLRIPDPCFKRPLSRSAKTGAAACEDSAELFSMGRIDSQWLAMASAGSKSQDIMHECHQRVLSETESDLFEIVLEGRG